MLLYLQVCLALRRPCLPARWQELDDLIDANRLVVARPIRYHGRRYWLTRGYTFPKTEMGSPRQNWYVCKTRPTATMSAGQENVGPPGGPQPSERHWRPSRTRPGLATSAPYTYVRPLGRLWQPRGRFTLKAALVAQIQH